MTRKTREVDPEGLGASPQKQFNINRPGIDGSDEEEFRREDGRGSDAEGWVSD